MIDGCCPGGLAGPLLISLLLCKVAKRKSSAPRCSLAIWSSIARGGYNKAPMPVRYAIVISSKSPSPWQKVPRCRLGDGLCQHNSAPAIPGDGIRFQPLAALDFSWQAAVLKTQIIALMAQSVPHLGIHSIQEIFGPTPTASITWPSIARCQLRVRPVPIVFPVSNLRERGARAKAFA